MRRYISLALTLALAAQPLAAQSTRVHGFPSPWFTATIGGGQLALSCATCEGADRLGGVAFQLGGGVALSDQFAIGVQGRRLAQIGFESTSSATIGTGVIQFIPARMQGMSFELGAGRASIGGNNSGHATVVELGTTLRLPETSVVGFTLQASYIKALSGRHDANGSQFPAGEWRPSLFTIGLGADLRFLK